VHAQNWLNSAICLSPRLYISSAVISRTVDNLIRANLCYWQSFCCLVLLLYGVLRKAIWKWCIGLLNAQRLRWICSIDLSCEAAVCACLMPSDKHRLQLHRTCRPSQTLLIKQISAESRKDTEIFH